MLKTIIFTLMMATIYRQCKQYKRWNFKRWNLLLGLLLAGGGYMQALAVGEQHDNQGAVLQMVQNKDKKDLLSQKQKDLLQKVEKDLLQSAEGLKKQTESMHGVGEQPQNILDIIRHLAKIEDYNYESASATGRDYIDMMCHIYYDMKRHGGNDLSNETVKLLLRDFRVKFKSLLNVPIKLAKLKSLGLTDLDIAMLNEDVAYVKAEASKDTQRTPLQLVKKYRIIEIAQDMGEDGRVYRSEEEMPLMGVKHEFSSFWHCLYEQVDRLRSPLPKGGKITFGELLNYLSANIYKDIPAAAKTMFVSISGNGRSNSNMAWDNAMVQYNCERMAPCFDASMLMGDGRRVLASKDADSMIKALHEAAKLGLDFILVLIEMHDAAQASVLREFILRLPGNVAKETLYVIDGCHSVQYHKDWLHQHKDAVLITTAGYALANAKKLGKKAAEACKDGVDVTWKKESGFTRIVKQHELYALLKSDSLAKPNLKKFIAYYAKAVKLSSPWISGKLEGRFRAKMRLTDYVKKYITTT